MFPKFSRDLKIIALMAGDIDKSTITGKFEIGLGCASADGLFRLAVKISPKMPRNRRRLDTDRVCCALQNAGFIKKFNDQIGRLTQTYVLDPEMRERIAKLNPKASARVASRLLEAHERNYWSPDSETLSALREAGDELEDRLEGVAPGPAAA